MGWSLGYDPTWERDIGYGVPAYCDHPKCAAEIDRGLSYVCGGNPYGGEHGCGLFFCAAHLLYHWKADGSVYLCARCDASKAPYARPKPDHPTWIHHKLTDESWAEWRAENPREVETLQSANQRLGKESKQ